MSTYWILFIILASLTATYIIWVLNKSEDFSALFETRLKKDGFKFISATYPGLFNVGPFEKIEIRIGKPQINDGIINYEKTYYRIVELKTKNKKTVKVWAKIETSWFKTTKVEFRPPLSELEKCTHSPFT